MVSDHAAIRAWNIRLELPLRRDAHSLRGAAARIGGNIIRRNKGKSSVVLALDGIDLDLPRGTRIGLIGSNGAGKSTLLRVLAGIYKPTSGHIVTQGKISTLFTSRIGINQQVTGRENILLSGLLLGFTRKEIEAMMPDIIDFAGLGDFIDLSLHTYSTGMATRLGFAIATAIQPEILLIDEVFGAGDRDFQTKARNRVTALMEKAGTLVLASHSVGIIRRFCSQALWIEHGRVRAIGTLDEVLEAYEEAVASSRPSPPGKKIGGGKR